MPAECCATDRLADNHNPERHLHVDCPISSATDHPEPKLTDAAPETPAHAVWVAELAWLGGDRLESEVVIEAHDGSITSISRGPAPEHATRLRGVVVPGLVNAHSHAFHRLLRGMTHRQGGDFWLWRSRMYEVAAALTPESYQRLATAVFVEMAMAGITTVGEFHYLHHQPGGVPYEEPNEMGHALVRSARAAGIRIGLLDAGYFRAGFDDRPLDPVQTRFRDGSAASWLDRVDSLRTVYAGADDVAIGLAPHSVRAVPEAALSEVAGRRDTVAHIHLSEQPAENEECLATTGHTPTGLLARAGLLRPGTTLVHATHLTSRDVTAIGEAGSTVCYCATTERDLADGIGPAHDLHSAGARLCAGSDSHAVIDMFEEARGIETHARLATGRRGSFDPPELLRAVTLAGSSALGFDAGGLAVGSPADFIVVDTGSPRLAGMRHDTALDTVVFAASSADVSDVFVSGRQIVDGGNHPGWLEARHALDEHAPGH